MSWVRFYVTGHRCPFVTGHDYMGNLRPFMASSLASALAFQRGHGGKIVPVDLTP